MLPKTLVAMETGPKVPEMLSLAQKLTFSQISPEFFITLLIFDMILHSTTNATNMGSSAMYIVCYQRLLCPWKRNQNIRKC